MSTNTPHNPLGRPRIGTGKQHPHTVTLPGYAVAHALKLGNGNLSKGIRQAIQDSLALATILTHHEKRGILATEPETNNGG